MHSTDFFVLAVVTAGIALLASSFHRRGRSSYDFLAAGRNVPGWLLGLSIFATWTQPITYMGYPGNAFKGDWSIVVYTIPIPFIAWAAGRWAVPFFRRHKDISAFVLLEERFGLATRRGMAKCYLLSQMLRTGVILFLLCMPISEMLGWNTCVSIVVVSALTTAYTMLGGLRGAVWSEAMQGLLIAVAIVVSIFILTGAMPNGVAGSFETARDSGKLSIVSSYEGMGTASMYIIIMYSIVSTCGRLFFDQSHVQRYHAATSNRVARRSVMLGAAAFVAATLLLMAIGTMLYCYYSEFSVMLPNNIPHDYIFPFFAINQMPVGVCGLLVASLLASGMASFSSYLVSGASVILNDLSPELAISRDEKRRKEAINRGCVLLSAGATLTAILLTAATQWTNFSWMLSILMFGGVIGAFLLAVLLKGMKQRVAAAAIASGLAVSLATFVWELAVGINTSLYVYLATIGGVASTLLVGWLLKKATHITPSAHDNE